MGSMANPRRVNPGRAVATGMDVATGATDHSADTVVLDLVAYWTTDSPDLATGMGQGTTVTITGPTDIPSFPMVDTNISLSTLANLPSLPTTSPSLMPLHNLKLMLLLSPSRMLPLNLRPMQLLRLTLPHNLIPMFSLLQSMRHHNRILTLSLLHNTRLRTSLHNSTRLPPHPHQRHIHNLNMPNHTLHVC